MKTKTVSRTETIKDYKQLKLRCSALVREVGLLTAAQQYDFLRKSKNAKMPFPEADKESVLHELRAAIEGRLTRLQKIRHDKKAPISGEIIRKVQGILQ